MIAAFVISQGYDEWNMHILEIEYRDFAYPDERRVHFFVECHASARGFLRSDPLAISYSRLAFLDQAVEFLSDRYLILKSLFPGPITFAFKGPVKRLLRDAGITDLVDLETLGVPATLWLDHIYQEESCPAHSESSAGAKRCARRVSRLVTRFLRNNGELMKKRGMASFPVAGRKLLMKKNRRSDRILAGCTL